MILSLNKLGSKVKRKQRKVVGRGSGSGHGTYSGRGIKGQHARSGGSHVPGFEGGRTTIIMQTPKSRGKGFRTRQPEFEVVSLGDLNRFKDGDIVTLKSLRAAGLASDRPVKVVGGDKLSRKLDVRVAVTAKAREAIIKIGGTIPEPKAISSEEKKVTKQT
ncbi:MAG: 50S ribosomal protein L15 [Candidatus Doudnabacteria bacterium RIFCSPHIGHO2_01_FULL_50_11]|uniref:Large ribosomal subunit protein uL15 n=1 Tax=Candidatus Doudnabacteria bacterium RIFCSPHIGHO2_01_FULL_50_11 TaxID=1817828 RepID=A0A1F5PIR0_9BACT|nr:ribosomal protein L15 [uncultured bacterium]OGE89749.1 MAG: 50S ribosomal protein L15 [Candidatus Doudnabacteria bacterium RIFCSPHIGHO2_01_FULL_50_11]HLC44852.1 50S ribosomal protein L15 [Patescibacteria group bacterium]